MVQCLMELLLTSEGPRETDLSLRYLARENANATTLRSSWDCLLSLMKTNIERSGPTSRKPSLVPLELSFYDRTSKPTFEAAASELLERTTQGLCYHLSQKDIYLGEFKPKAKLVVKTTQVDAPRFPVIDAHLHLGSKFGGEWLGRPVEALLEALDAAHVRTVVDLDGGWGERHFRRAPQTLQRAFTRAVRSFRRGGLVTVA